jgi:O-antigen/teichoic acid export membrane protein
MAGMPFERSTLFLIALAALLPLIAGGALLWRRFYRDDPTNTARRVLKNSAVPLALRMFVRALDMAFFVILQRTLPGAQIGPYDLATLYVGQYLATIAEFGLGVLLTREAARDPTAARRLFGVTLAMRLVLVLLASAPAAFLLISGYGVLGALGVGEPISPIGQIAIWVLLLTLLPSAYSGAVTALYNANERMEIPALVEVCTAVLGLVARLAALWLGFGVLGLAWASVLVTTLTAGLFLVLQIRDFYPPTLVWNTQQMRQIGVIALPLMLNNLLNAVFFRFDILIIKAFGGGQGDLLVNQYSVPYKVLGIAMILPPVVTFAVFPLLSRRAGGDRAAMAQAQNGTLRLLLLVGFPLAAAISVLATDLIWLVNGRNTAQFLPISADVLAILAWFLPFSFVNGLLQYVLIALNRQTSITRAFLIGAFFNLAANLLFVPRYGLYAAAVITILSELVLLAVFLPILRQEGLLPPLPALAWRPLVASLVMAMAMLIAQRVAGWLAAALIAGPVYAGMLWLLGAIGPEERGLLRRVLGRE